MIERSRDPRKIWVFRTPSKTEKFIQECVAPYTKGTDIKLIIWGCFWGVNKGTMVLLIVKSVNHKVYLDICHYCVLPVVQRVHDTLGDPIFMQDNAPVHRAYAVRDWFEDHNVQVMNWPQPNRACVATHKGSTTSSLPRDCRHSGRSRQNSPALGRSITYYLGRGDRYRVLGGFVAVNAPEGASSARL